MKNNLISNTKKNNRKPLFIISILLLSFIFLSSLTAAVPSTINGTLSNKLIAYYSFNESDIFGNGTIYDDLNNFNGTNYFSNSTTGKLNNAYYFNGTSAILINSLDTELNNNFTISYWMKFLTNESQAINRSWFISGSPYNTYCTLNYPEFLCYINGNNYVRYLDSFFLLNEWYNVIVTYNSTDYNLYIDGTQNFNDTTYINIYYEGGINADNNSAFTIGNDAGNYNYGFNGVLDEFAVFNESLNSSEVLQLYNGYKIIIPPTISLLLPINNKLFYSLNNTNSTIINFSVNISSINTINNVSLFINNIINQTNTSGYNGIYNFSSLLSNGIYNWSIKIYDDNIFYNSTTKNFIIASYVPSASGSISDILILLFMNKDTETPSWIKIMIILAIIFGIAGWFGLNKLHNKK